MWITIAKWIYPSMGTVYTWKWLFQRSLFTARHTYWWKIEIKINVFKCIMKRNGATEEKKSNNRTSTHRLQSDAFHACTKVYLHFESSHSDFYLVLVAKCVRAWTIVPLSVQWYVTIRERNERKKTTTKKEKWTAEMQCERACSIDDRLFNKVEEITFSSLCVAFVSSVGVFSFFCFSFAFLVLCKSQTFIACLFIRLNDAKSHKSYLLRATEMQTGTVSCLLLAHANAS